MERDGRNYTPSPTWLKTSSASHKQAPAPKRKPRFSAATASASGSTDDEDCSPPLPPKPKTSTAPPSIRTSTSSASGQHALPLEKGPFTLPEFVSKFGHSLPLCVSVEKGFQSDDERESIAMGDSYNLHLVKRSKVVELREASGETHNIPLSSSLQFAPVFNDSDDTDTDQTFERVSDIVSLKPLPRLLRATKTFSKDNKSLVEKNEVFVVQKVISTPLRKKTLQVYSTLFNREKILPNDCEGGFTADPYATRLHLPDIISLFIEEFPLRVRVHLTDFELENESDFPFHLSSEVSVLTEMKTEISIVASTYWQDGQPSAEQDEQRFIEIPISLEIEVSILQPDHTVSYVLSLSLTHTHTHTYTHTHTHSFSLSPCPFLPPSFSPPPLSVILHSHKFCIVHDHNVLTYLQEKDLFHRTRSLLESFNSAKIHTINKSSSNLTFAPRQGYEREGVEIEEPNRVYEVISHRTLFKPRRQEDENLIYAEILQDTPPTSTHSSLTPDKTQQRSPPPLSPKPNLKKRGSVAAAERTQPPYQGTERALPPHRATVRTPPPHRATERTPPPHQLQAEKRAVDRKLSVDSASSERELTYQPLIRRSPSPDSNISAYVTLNRRPPHHSVTGARSEQTLLSSLATAAATTAGVATAGVGGTEDFRTLIRDLIGRIQALEQQVAELTNRVDVLT